MQMKVTSEQAKQLLTDQLSVWESARDNYKALEAVQVKELTVEGCTVKIQFNPIAERAQMFFVCRKPSGSARRMTRWQLYMVD